MSLNLGLSDNFLVRLILCILGKNTTKVKHLSHCIISGGTHNVDTTDHSIIWLKLLTARLLRYIITILPFAYRSESLSLVHTQGEGKLSPISYREL